VEKYGATLPFLIKEPRVIIKFFKEVKGGWLKFRYGVRLKDGKNRGNSEKG